MSSPGGSEGRPSLARGRTCAKTVDRQRVTAEGEKESLDHTQRLMVEPWIWTPESQLCYLLVKHHQANPFSFLSLKTHIYKMGVTIPS